ELGRALLRPGDALLQPVGEERQRVEVLAERARVALDAIVDEPGHPGGLDLAGDDDFVEAIEAREAELAGLALLAGDLEHELAVEERRDSRLAHSDLERVRASVPESGGGRVHDGSLPLRDAQDRRQGVEPHSVRLAVLEAAQRVPRPRDEHERESLALL